jgi:hypothetical protein
MKKIICGVVTLCLISFVGISFAYEGGPNISASSAAGSYSNQRQGQAQTTSSTSAVENSGNSAVAFNNSFNGSKPIRYLPVSPEVNYQGLQPSMFSRPQPDKGENFIPAKTLIDLMNAWAVDNISDDDIDTDEIILDITTVGEGNPDAFDTDDATIKFELNGTPQAKAVKDAGSKPIAIGTIKSTEDDINTAELFMTLVKKAREVGATNVILLSEGIKVELESSGWGIGFSYNYASVNSDLYGQGSVGAGGTGISGGSASYKKMPYLTFAFMQ